jgi:hypothetical protein
MNTLTRSAFKTSHAIGENTENKAFNWPHRAAQIFREFVTGNHSDWIRDAIAEKLERESKGAALAFRAAIRAHKKAIHIILAVFIPLGAFVNPAFVARRVPRSSTLVRTVAFAARRQEVTA